MDNSPVPPPPPVPPLPNVPDKDVTVIFQPQKKKFSLNKKAVFFGLGFVVILIGLFAGALAIKSSQELKKKAVVGPGMYACGVRINPISEEKPTEANGGRYSTTYKIFYVGELSQLDQQTGFYQKCDGPEEKSFTFEYWTCVCRQGAGEPGGVCNQCEKKQETISLKKVRCDYQNSGDANAITRTLSASQPGGQICGSFQMDVNIVNCDGGASHGPVFGVYTTKVECVSLPTPTPTEIVVTATPTAPPVSPTPTVTQGVTPTATPTQPKPTPGACFSECSVDSDCDGDNTCLAFKGGTKRCLKAKCPEEVDCGCNLCWELCTNDWECTIDMKCLAYGGGSKRCVKESCPGSQNCSCEVTPTSEPQPTSTPGTVPASGIKATTAGGILGGFLMISLGLALIF